MANSIRIKANLGLEFWAFAVGCAISILTCKPHSALPNRMTPYERWYNRKPTFAHFRVFGCNSWYHIPKKLRRKLDFNAQRAIFVGYHNNQKAYKLWNPELRRVVSSRNVTFSEDEFTFWRSDSNPSTRSFKQLQELPTESTAQLSASKNLGPNRANSVSEVPTYTESESEDEYMRENSASGPESESETSVNDDSGSSSESASETQHYSDTEASAQPTDVMPHSGYDSTRRRL
jgi:hypothetical protein